jgi:hypothetical protein
MNSVRGRGGSNGSAASCKRESHEGRSHARSTSLSQLVAHPVGHFVTRDHTVKSCLGNQFANAVNIETSCAVSAPLPMKLYMTSEYSVGELLCRVVRAFRLKITHFHPLLCLLLTSRFLTLKKEGELTSDEARSAVQEVSSSLKTTFHLWRSFKWQSKPEGRAVTGSTLDPNASPMALDECSAQIET